MRSSLKCHLQLFPYLCLFLFLFLSSSFFLFLPFSFFLFFFFFFFLFFFFFFSSSFTFSYFGFSSIFLFYISFFLFFFLFFLSIPGQESRQAQREVDKKQAEKFAHLRMLVRLPKPVPTTAARSAPVAHGSRLGQTNSISAHRVSPGERSFKTSNKFAIKDQKMDVSRQLEHRWWKVKKLIVLGKPVEL